MFDYKIEKNQFHNSTNLSIIQNLHVHKIFQIIVIDQRKRYSKICIHKTSNKIDEIQKYLYILERS